MSIMEEHGSDVNHRIAERVRELRGTHSMSLDALAAKSGVSRSMISLIERGETSPTAAILEKLAAGLRVTLASLFDAPVATAPVTAGPVARREDQSEWKDPGSGYVRRNLSPPGIQQPFQLVEVHFPAGARVAFEAGVRELRVYEQVWLLDGVMEIAVGKELHRLRAGDCLALQLDQPTMFHNPGRKPARYLVAMASEPPRRRPV
jgi:transcriptional regulator with XRE-family HTH domain